MKYLFVELEAPESGIALFSEETLLATGISIQEVVEIINKLYTIRSMWYENLDD